jgi:hypothetical protein
MGINSERFHYCWSGHLRNVTTDDYKRVAEEIRATLLSRVQWLQEKQTADNEERVKYLLMWQLALVTAAWDVSGSAIRLAMESELRAARILNRSIFEYGLRLHHYAHEPEDAVQHGAEALNYLRHVMRPTGSDAGDMSKKRFKEFRTFLTSGSAELSYPQIHRMMKNMLRTFGFEAAGDIKRGVKRLEAEYAVSSAIAHGSQGLIFDVFRKDDSPSIHHLRSPWFSTEESLLRTMSSLLLCLTGLEIHFSLSMGTDMHMRSIDLMFLGAHETARVYTSNVLLHVLNDAMPKGPLSSSWA